MNLYTAMGRRIGTAEAEALSRRLAAWHDAMVAHERRLRAGRPGESCDEDCPHAQAAGLWMEALESFGGHAEALAFLRSQAARATARVSATPALPMRSDQR